MNALAEIAVHTGHAVFVLLVAVVVSACFYFAFRLAIALVGWLIEEEDRHGS